MNSDEFIDNPSEAVKSRIYSFFLPAVPEGSNVLPGEWGGGVHMSTTPWPSRTETPPLVFPLKAPRSGTAKTIFLSKHSKYIKSYDTQQKW